MSTNQKQSANTKTEIMMSDLLSAISESEYPQYILEAIEIIRDWIHSAVTEESQSINGKDIFDEFFGNLEENEAGDVDELFARLERLEDYANIVPNTNKENSKPETLIISLANSECDSGLRSAIDYAAVFNRPNCKRVWIVSDTFIFDEIVKFVPHVEKLLEEGISLRFILVTAWGWVEIPLCEKSVNKNQFLFTSQEKSIKRRKRK